LNRFKIKKISTACPAVFADKNVAKDGAARGIEPPMERRVPELWSTRSYVNM
jgi:hypothetical protein